jgi:hypothetical protein
MIYLIRAGMVVSRPDGVQYELTLTGAALLFHVPLLFKYNSLTY